MLQIEIFEHAQNDTELNFLLDNLMTIQIVDLF